MLKDMMVVGVYEYLLREWIIEGPADVVYELFGFWFCWSRIFSLGKLAVREFYLCIYHILSLT